MKISLAARLLKAANELDALGLYDEAGVITKMVKSAQLGVMPGQSPQIKNPNPAAATVPRQQQPQLPQQPQPQQPAVQQPQLRLPAGQLRSPSEIARQYSTPQSMMPPVNLPTMGPSTQSGYYAPQAGVQMSAPLVQIPAGNNGLNPNALMQQFMNSSSMSPMVSGKNAPTNRQLTDNYIKQYQAWAAQQQKAQTRNQPGQWTADSALQAQQVYDQMQKLEAYTEQLRKQYWQLTGQ